MNSENLQDGSIEHINEVLDNTDVVEYEYDDHYYMFEFKTNLEWSTKMNILVNNLKNSVDDLEDVSEEDLDLAGLYNDLLDEQIVDSNIDKVSIFLQRIPDDFGDQIAADIVDDVGLFEEDEGNLKKL